MSLVSAMFLRGSFMTIVNRQRLSEALKLASSGLVGKEIVEYSQSFRFTGSQIETIGSDVVTSVPMETGVEGLIPSGKILEFLSRCKDEEITIESSGGEILLSGKRVKVGIPMVDASPEEQEWPAPDGWSSLPDGFIEAVKVVVKSAGTDITKPVLTMIHGTENYLEAFDNYQFTRAFLGGSFKKKEDLLIPAARVPSLLSAAPTKYHQGGSWIYFQSADGLMLGFRTMDGSFEDLDQFIPTGPEVQFPVDIIDALQRAAVFVDSTVGEDFCRVSLTENMILVEARGTDGWLKETTRVRFKGEPVSMLIRPLPFAEALRYSSRAVIGESSLMLKSDRMLHVVWLPDD